MKKLVVLILILAMALVTMGAAQAGVSAAQPADGMGAMGAMDSLTLAALPQASLAAASPQLAAAAVIDFGGLTLGANYSPAHVFIQPGENVKWQGDFGVHPLVSDDGLWTTVNTAGQFEFVFNTAGVYHFHCLIHGAFGMTGTVTVGYRVFLPDVLK